MLVDVRTFRLRADVDEAAALAADHEVQVAFAHHQPGIVRRTTARATDGEWLVLTLWYDEQHASAADGAAEVDAACRTFAAMVDGAPVVRRYTDVGG